MAVLITLPWPVRAWAPTEVITLTRPWLAASCVKPERNLRGEPLDVTHAIGRIGIARAQQYRAATG